jgi:hypothetical protein
MACAQLNRWLNPYSETGTGRRCERNISLELGRPASRQRVRSELHKENVPPIPTVKQQGN